MYHRRPWAALWRRLRGCLGVKKNYPPSTIAKPWSVDNEGADVPACKTRSYWCAFQARRSKKPSVRQRSNQFFIASARVRAGANNTCPVSMACGDDRSKIVRGRRSRAFTMAARRCSTIANTRALLETGGVRPGAAPLCGWESIRDRSRRAQPSRAPLAESGRLAGLLPGGDAPLRRRGRSCVTDATAVEGRSKPPKPKDVQGPATAQGRNGGQGIEVGSHSPGAGRRYLSVMSAKRRMPNDPGFLDSYLAYDVWCRHHGVDSAGRSLTGRHLLNDAAKSACSVGPFARAVQPRLRFGRSASRLLASSRSHPRDT